MTSSPNRPAATTPPTETADTAEAPKPALDLSFTKIAGGALASVTTAVAASFFGVNGTLAGAAFGSVVSSIAAAVYAASFHTAGTRIKATRSLVLRSGAPGSAPFDPESPTALPPDLIGRSVPLPGETMVLPTGEGVEPHYHGSYQQPTPYGSYQQPPPPPPSGRRAANGRSRGFPWVPVVALAGLAFVISLGVITTVELVLKHPISNSQEQGPSVANLGGGNLAATHSSTTSSTKRTRTSSSSETSSSSATESPSPTDSASLAPGETSSSTDPGATTSQPGGTDQATPTSQTQSDRTQGGQATENPTQPTQSSDTGASNNGAAASSAGNGGAADAGAAGGGAAAVPPTSPGG